METEKRESHLPAETESEVKENTELQGNSESAAELRMPQQGDLNVQCIKVEGSSNVKDAGFEFVDLQMVIKQEKSSEENLFSNATYASCDKLLAETESESKEVIHINTETLKVEVSDSATSTDFEASSDAVPLKAETTISNQDVKVEIETVPINESELEIMETPKMESAIRTAKWRKEKRSDLDAWDSYLKKDRERNRIKREREKLKCEKDEHLLKMKREKARERARKWRKRKASEKFTLKKMPEEVKPAHLGKLYTRSIEICQIVLPRRNPQLDS